MIKNIKGEDDKDLLKKEGDLYIKKINFINQ